MTTPLREDNIIKIGGRPFRMRDFMQITNIAVPPNPVVFGDTTRSSETQAMFQLIQSSYTAGSGKYYGNSRTDTERFWDSDWDSRYREQLTFPPEIVDLGIPPGAASELTCSAVFRGTQYFALGDRIYSLNDTTGVFQTENSLPSNAIDMIVAHDNLFVSLGAAGYYRLSGIAPAPIWIAVTTQAANLWGIWQGSLYNVYYNGTQYAMRRTSVAAPESWGADIGLFAIEITPYQLVRYPDADGADALYAMTNMGPWIYNNVDHIWLPTDVEITHLPPGETSRATRFRDGKLYFTSGGTSMMTMQNGNPVTVGTMGLDRDDGLPLEQQGQLVAIASDNNWIFTLMQVQNVTPDTENTMPAMSSPPVRSEGWSYGSGPVTLRAWNSGWAKLYTSPTATSAGPCMVVGNSYGKRRLYFSVGRHIMYLDLPAHLYNPRQNPTTRFRVCSPVHITPWWDYGNWTMEKIHGHVLFEIKGADANNYVDVWYGMDFDDGTWYYVGRIATSGLTSLQVGGPTGIQARFFRLKFQGAKHPTDPYQAPMILFYDSEVMRVLPATYGYGFQLDLSSAVGNLSPIQQIQFLKQLIDPRVTRGLYEFAYQPSPDSTPNTFYGRISRINGQEATGLALRGKGTYQITVIVPYDRDVT
jgi:hypothetical protein